MHVAMSGDEGQTVKAPLGQKLMKQLNALPCVQAVAERRKQDRL